MWMARISQIIGLLLAIVAIGAIIFLLINFPVQTPDNLGNRMIPVAYLVFLAPIAGLYLLFGTTSTFFLFSEKRRTSYGFRAEPWRSVFWANLAATMAFGGVQLIIALSFLSFIAFRMGVI